MTAADWSSRLAGGLMIVLGVLNLALGLFSLVSDQVRLATGVAGGLVAAGLVTAAAGVLVTRGHRVVTIASLTVFAMLLVFQVTELAADDAAGGVVEQAGPRIVVLAVVVVALAVATWRLRHRTPVTSRR